jgi:hypothetical protein
MELSAFLDFGISLLSFGLIEPLWGASPAKWLLRLRVRDKGFGPAKPSQILRRNVIFYLIGSLPWELFVLGFAQMRGSAWLSPLLGGVRLVCIGILAFPMRASNGFRGLHDLWTDTRVVSLPRIERRKAPTEARRKIGRERGVTRPVGVLQSVGPFKVRGAVRWEPNRKVLAGEDSALGREAWIVLRPSSSHPPDVARRSLARPTRPRWLTGGEQREGRWDAFVAPAGCPLVDLAGPKGLPWHDARPILEDLADEVVAASADGTLPEGLALDLVWVEPDGRTQIVDPLGIVDEARDQSKPADQESRGLDLIRLAAAVALEGGRRRGGDLATPIRAPVPIHARKILDLLMDRKKGYDSIEALRANLRDTREKPTAVTRMMRGTHLGVQAALLLIGLYFLCLIAYAFASRRFEVFFPEGPAERLSVSSGRELLGTVIMIAIPLAWIIWATVFRGGLSLPLVGLSLVGNEGKPASRWRAGLRALLVWAPLAAIWTLAIWLREWLSAWPDVALGVYGIGVVYLLVLIPWALVRPERGFHDRLAGTWIVPR